MAMASRLAMWARTLHAPVVGGLDGGRHLGPGHLGAFGRAHGAVPAGGEHLDDAGPFANLGPHASTELLRPVADPKRPFGTELPPPRGTVVDVARGGHVAAAGNEARARDRPFGDGAAHGGIDGEGRTGTHRRGEPRPQDRFEVAHRPHRLQRGGSSRPKGAGLAPSS